MDRGAWRAAVHGVAKSRTRLSDFTLTFHFHALEKEMATYSSVLVWRIPGTGEHCGLPSMGSHRVRHDWNDLAAAAAVGYKEKAMAPHSNTLAWKIPWMEEPGRLQSMRSLRVGHDFTFTFHFHELEKETATHSSVLAWRIPGTEEPDKRPSMG